MATAIAPDRSSPSYGSVAIAFHWTIAALVIFNLLVGIGHEGIPALRALMGAHKAVGITVLFLTLARIAWRLSHRPPPLPADVTPGQRATAHAVHWSLYALMLLMPLTGWMFASAGANPRPLTWFGLFPIPYLRVSEPVGNATHQAHGVLGWLMLALAALHIAAALYHHLAKRDAVLLRMLPIARNR